MLTISLPSLARRMRDGRGGLLHLEPATRTGATTARIDTTDIDGWCSVILFGNVMIYVNRAPRNRGHELIHRRLTMFGVPGLGGTETRRFAPRGARRAVAMGGSVVA